MGFWVAEIVFPSPKRGGRRPLGEFGSCIFPMLPLEWHGQLCGLLQPDL